MEKNIHNLEKVIDALTTFYSKNSLESYKEKLVVTTCGSKYYNVMYIFIVV